MLYFLGHLICVKIPEENRSIGILELIEDQDLHTFHQETLKLYQSLCALGNHRVAHILTK